MNTFTDTRIGAKESASEYMRKVVKITGYALSVNKVFIVLMLVASLLTIIIISSAFGIISSEFGMSSGNNEVPFILISAGLGFFMPIIMFQHMFKRGEYDFYASMPIKRSRYFWGFNLSGIIAFLMIYLFIFTILLVMNVHEIFAYFLPGLALFFAVYASVLLAVILSKSFFVFFLIFLILNGLVYLTLNILWIVVDVNCSLYLFASKEIIYFFTPFYTVELFFESKRNFILGLLPLGMAVIEFAAAFFLHRIRGNEGRSPLAFAKTRYPFQYIVMFMAAFLVSAGEFGNPNYPITGEKNIGVFLNIVFNDDSFVFYTLIVILITFIMTNIIFENTPRGVFRKIYHLIIFTVGYGIVFFLVIGGLIYPNVPMNFVPFESNAAVVMIRGYESKTRAEYDAVYDTWQKAQKNVYDFIDAHYSIGSNKYEYEYEEDSEYRRLREICEKALDEYNRWQNYGYSDEYCLRSTGVTLYLITDKEYLGYLSEKVRENADRRNYVDWEFGYQDIVAEPAIGIENDPGANDRFYNEYYFNNAKIMDIRFYDLSEERMEQLTGNFEEEGYEAIYHNFYRDYGNHRFDLRTFVDTEEGLKEFELHTADSFFTDKVSGIRYNFSPNSVY